MPKRKTTTDWNKTIGMVVDVLYNNEIYKIEILNNNSETRKITIKYNDTIDIISTDQFINGGIGRILGKYIIAFRYKIGDVIEVKNNKLLIMEQFYNKSEKSEKRVKMYKYKCLNCGNIHTISECKLKNNKGCNVCNKSPSKVLVGFNDINTTCPSIIKYLKNSEDKFKYSICSSKKIECKCTNCFFEKEVLVYKLTQKGFSCPKCGDGISFPNKFVFNVLSQLNINFEAEKVFQWSDKKQYDFYLNDINVIIEVNGEQHYSENNFYKKLEETINNDLYKKNLALNNGVFDYLIIDARKSESDFIKKNILGSKLTKYYDFNSINWNVCENYANTNKILEVIELWNNNISIIEISKKLKISKTTIYKYLKKGNSIGKCIFKVNKRNIQKVKYLKTGDVFNSISECSRYLNIDRGTIRLNKKKLFEFETQY